MRVGASSLEGVPPSWQLVNGLWGLLLLFGLLLSALWVRHTLVPVLQSSIFSHVVACSPEHISLLSALVSSPSRDLWIIACVCFGTDS